MKPMWDAKAVKAYETGQGVELVSKPHPHYRPLPEDLNPDTLETVEIDLPQPAQRTWVGLTQTEVVDLLCEYNKLTGNVGWQQLIYMTEAKLKEKNT